MKDWISLKEFMKINKVGYDVAMKMIHEGKIDCIKTDGGRYKIRVVNGVISKSMYDLEVQKRIEAEAKIKMLKQFVEDL